MDILSARAADTGDADKMAKRQVAVWFQDVLSMQGERLKIVADNLQLFE